MRAKSSAVSAYLILFSLLWALSSCNLREDILLPPNLDPKDYVIANTIRVYSDHLIPSDNDDSYLYLPRESISDSLLWYGDELTLQKVDTLLTRDSLAFADETVPVTETYKVTVIREGAEILLDSIPAFATLYTELSSSATDQDLHLLSLRYQLKAQPAQPQPYGRSRVFFDLDGSGEFSLVDFNNGNKIQISGGDREIEALMVTDQDYLQIWIPSAFRSEAGSGTIGLEESLQDSEIEAIQNVFPGFAVQSKILKINTTNTVSSSDVPILHYRMPASKGYGTQWIRLDDGSLFSWESDDDTWKITDGVLISFVNGAGSYLLLEPLSTQNSLGIPLDGSLSQLYLPGIWLDLSTAVVPGTYLQLSETQDLPRDYYNGDPFTIQGAYQAYQISFTQGRTPLENLPDGKWLEFGFQSSLPLRSNMRLSRIYRTKELDHLDYKVFGDEYDEGHYTISGGYVYSGINSSGTYLYASIGEDAQSLTIPCLKEELRLQTSRTYLSWEDHSLPCSSLNLSYDAPITEDHPWLSGYPYQYSGNALLKLSATSGDAATDELPENLFISHQSSASPSSVINFSPSATYPRFYRYEASDSFAHNTFVYSDGRLQISPAVAGYLISADDLTPPQNGNLRLYNRMVFDDYDWELYLDSVIPMPAGNTLQYSVLDSFADPYGVFSEQYQLSALSRVYSFEVTGDAGFFDLFQPYIRLRQAVRSRNLLFSEIEADYYRIYSYEETDQADGWSFAISDGHIAFLLAHPGRFAAVTDTDEHDFVDVTVSSVRDLHLSLYQAQFILPQEYIGLNVLPGTHFTLSALSEIPPGITANSAYQLQIRDAQLNPIYPNFFNYPEMERYPYIYLPIEDYVSGMIPQLFYRDPMGTNRELLFVTEFSDNPVDEFSIVGNCIVAFVQGSGIFYLN